MKVHLISPEGERVGTFPSHQAAAYHASQTWPDKVGGCREEQPDTWAMEIEADAHDRRRLRRRALVKTTSCQSIEPQSVLF